MIGSHSAEEIAVSAKMNDFKTVVFCQKGREKLYSFYNKHLYDHIIILDKFEHVLYEENINKLKELDTIIIPNRSLTAYLGFDGVEKWPIPIYGNRFLQRIEDRDYKKNQYWLMDQTAIRRPEMFSHKEIPKLAIVKVQQKHKPLERAFFYVSDTEDLRAKGDKLIENGLIDENELQNAVIEEFVLGPRFNANYHSFAITSKFPPGFEFVGFDDRVQTNLQGILNLPAKDQLKFDVPLTNEEVGHRTLTIRESKKKMIYDVAEKFIQGVKKHFPPKVIGMFALQGAFNDSGEFVIFDISPRVPGSPVLSSTSPELKRLSLKYGKSIDSPLDFSMMEIQYAIDNDLLENITT
jgi:5-formaminoimidazole-4-carboxamide-1-(beta)-D-ribofuranosyl 5'-monophosphate synthetase